jgi:hypothetical protein
MAEESLEVEESGYESGIDYLFIIFVSYLVLAIAAYIAKTFIGMMPLSYATQYINLWVNGFFSFIDLSFFPVFLLLLVIETYNSSRNPSKKYALMDLIALFALGYMNNTIQYVMSGLTPLTTNSLMPTTATIMGGSTLVFVLYFFLIINILLNLRGVVHEEETPMYQFGGGGAGEGIEG